MDLSLIDRQMGHKLVERHTRVLNEFGHFSAEQLADLNHSPASNRVALADNWKHRCLALALCGQALRPPDLSVPPPTSCPRDH